MRRTSKQAAALRALFVPLHDDEDWVEGREKMLDRQKGCMARMAAHDRMPAPLRAVARGLPTYDLLFQAVLDGCTTQVEAEEWMRAKFGASVLG